MVGTFRYKCIQSPQSGQPVYSRLLTLQACTATFLRMRKPILLSLLVVALLGATLSACLLYRGRVVFLVDATYSRTVYHANERTLKRRLLLNGYLPSSLEVVPSEFDEQLLMGFAEKGRIKPEYLVLSPLLSELLPQHYPEGMEQVHCIRIGEGESSFDGYLAHLIPAKHFDWQQLEKRLGTSGSALVLADGGQALPAFDPSRTVIQKEGESEQAFSLRLENLCRERSLLTLFAPQLGPWAMKLLAESGLSWVVDAAYAPLVDAPFLQGVVSDDLCEGLLAVLEGQGNSVQLAKRYFTAREIGGNFL